MIDPNTLLQRLRRSLHILEQRQAKLGINAPPDLILEIEDHQTAMRLTEQLAKGYLTEAAWREQLRPLLVKIEARQATEPVSSLNIGGVNFDNISNSTITVGNITTGVHAGGDVIGGDKVTQTAEGSHIVLASHGGNAEVNTSTVDQRGQQVSGNQYNAAGDIHIHQAASPVQRTGFAVVGLLVGLAANVAINLLSAAIQQRYFPDEFSEPSMWLLAAFAIGGSLIGLWLSGSVTVPAAEVPLPNPPPSGRPARVTITRLRALLSYTKLRGQGIHLSDILLIGSRLDIDVEE